MMATKLLVCLFLMAAATAVPVKRNELDDEPSIGELDDEPSIGQCARQCQAYRQKFDYQPGRTYFYDYEAEADTLMGGASEEKARMQIQVRAFIDVTDRCEHTLRLRNVKVSHSEPGQNSLKRAEREREFRKELTAKALRYSFDDGIIRDICHSSSEKVWVLNFKRGILSALQNSLERFPTKEMQTIREVDVNGNCPAEYSEKEEGWFNKKIKVKKSKDLLSCLNRSNIRSIIPMVPYQAQSDVQSMPVMKSTHECEQEVKEHRIVKSICKESHVFAPFSNHQSGARTDVRQTLTFKYQKATDDNTQVEVDTRSNLLYQHVNGNEEIKNSVDLAEKKLQEICEQTNVDIRPETPRQFTELVQIVKQMDKSDLDKIYSLIVGKRICSQNNKAEKFLLDTLPVAGTTGAVSLMAEVINHDEVSDTEKQVWLTAISLITEPNEDMIAPLSKLLEGPSADQAMLPVSALLHTMCQKNVDCDNSYAFDGIVRQILNNIDSYCTAKDRSKVLRTLRAIGNIGSGRDLKTRLVTCMQSTNAPLEVNVAAADAFRRFPCPSATNNDETRALFDVFESQNADSELRIVSFRSLMRCPNEKILDRIAEQLDREQDENVGTYVYTYLTNLVETSDPHKQETREAVRRLILKPFEGGMKASRNLEASALFNKVNLGYVAEGDLIQSKSSMAPRAVRVNLTVELFGNSVNVFEAGARADGLDQFVEKYFGQNGYFPNNDKTKPEDLEAFIYARMFGNEMFFKNVKGTDEFKKLKSKLNFETILEACKEFDFKYTHTQQLMDDSFIFPTAIGLPVNLTINSTVSVNAEAKGNIQLSGFFSSVFPIDINSDLMASAGFEVTGSMMVDAILYKQGLRMRNTLHSSVNVNSNLMIKDREIVSFEIQAPEQKQELFDARSQFFVIHDNVENEQKMIEENRNEIKKCTGDKIGKVTGLQLCGQIEYPNATMIEDAPYFPFTGPARATVVLQKVDTQRSYKLFAKWIRNAKKLEAQLQLDTPGSQVDRHISADMTIGIHKGPHVDIILRSPWKKLVVNGHAAKNSQLVTLAGSVVVDDDKNYKLSSEVKIDKQGKKKTFTPSIELDYDGKKHLSILTGSVVYEQWKELTASLDINNILRKPLLLDGQIVNRENEKRLEVAAGSSQRKQAIARIGAIIDGKKRKTCNAQILVQTHKQVVVEITSKSQYQPKPLKIKTDISVDNMWMEVPVTAHVEVGHRGKKYPVKMSVNSQVFEGSLKGSVAKRRTSYVSSFKVRYETPQIKEKVTISAKLQNNTATNRLAYMLSSAVNFAKNKKYNSVSSLTVTSNQKSAAELNVWYGDNPKDKNKHVKVTASYNNAAKSKLNAQVTASVPEKNVDMSVKLSHALNPQKIDSEVNLHLAPFLENDINAEIVIQNKSRSLHHHVSTVKIEAAGQKYQLKSDVEQKSKNKIAHSVIMSNGEIRHTIDTSYLIDKNNQYNIDSTVKSTQFEGPIEIKASSFLNDISDFHIKGSVSQKRQETHAVKILSKVDQNDGKWHVRLDRPDRKVRAKADFKKRKNEFSANANINWDVDSRENPSPEIDVYASVTQRNQKGLRLLKSNVVIKTPFEDYEEISSDMKLQKHKKEVKSTGTLSWGKDKKQITTDLTVQVPLSVKNAQVTFTATTPIEDYNNVEIEINHSLDSRMKTKLRGKMGKHQTKISIDEKEDNNDKPKKNNQKKTFIRRLHLNYDYDNQDAVDIQIYGLNDKLQKFIYVKADTPKLEVQKLATGINIDLRKGLSTTVNFELQKQEQKDGYVLALDLKATEDKTSSSIEIKTPLEKLKQFTMEYTLNGNYESKNKQMTLLMNKDDIKLIDVSAESDVDSDQVTMKTTAQGEVMYLIIKKLGSLSIIPKIDEDMYGNKIKELILQYKLNHYDTTHSIEGKMTADYVKTLMEPSITVTKTGNSLNDIEVDIMLSNGPEALEGVISLKLNDDVQIKALVKNNMGPFKDKASKHGIEFSHTKNADKSEITGKLYLHELSDFESSFNLLVSSIQHVELKAISKSSYRGFELNSLTYTHNGQDNRVSCSVAMEDFVGVIASVELVGQSSPVKMFSVNVITPVNGFTKLIITGSYDDRQVNALVKLNDHKAISLSGSHENFKNPKLTLTTPMRQLKQLTVNIGGEQLSEISVDFQLDFNADDMMAGNIAVNYNTPAQLGVKIETSSRLDGTKNNLKMEVAYKHQPRHVSHLLLSMNDQDKIKYDFKETSESNNQLDIEVMYPSLNVNSKGVVLSLKGDHQKSSGTVQVMDIAGKIFDADINVNTETETGKKASLTVRQPKYMEYRITQENNRNSQQNKISYNWDKSNPDANVEVRVIVKDESDSRKIDKLVSLTFTCPLRSVGVEQSIFASDAKIKSSGKVFWNKQDDSQLSYDLELRDDSDRRNTAYGGDLKVKLPTRTLGVSGYAKDEDTQRQAQTVFSWDLDNDSTKKVGLKTTIAKGDHVQADVSLILPKDAHVDSKLVLNKGNIIVEGQTQIVYSNDPMKTLTLFSKVENQPGSRGFFSRTENRQNYSIQFGMSHPDSRIDVKMISHLGIDDDRLTTSVGLDYLTSRRQNQNLDLFLEINKLKKEINLIMNNPYRNVAVTGAVKSQDPLELSLTTIVNDQQLFTSGLKVNPEQRSIDYNWYDEFVKVDFQASVPDKNSLLLVRNVEVKGQREQDFKVVIHLPSPRILETNVYWKPGMLVDIRDRMFQRMKERTASVKDLIDEIAPSVEKEVTDKYRDIVESIIKDVQNIAESVINEIVVIENDLEQVQQKLREDLDICDIHIGEYSMKQDIATLKDKVASKLERLAKAVSRHSTSSKENLRSWSKQLEDVKNRQPHQFYSQAKMTISYYENRIFKTWTFGIMQFLREISHEELDNIWDYIDRKIVQRSWDPNPLLDSISDDIRAAMNTSVSSVIRKALHLNNQTVSKVVSIVVNTTDKVLNHQLTATIIHAWDQSFSESEVYQILKWSASYWQVRETVPRHIQNVLPWIHDIVEEEIGEYVNSTIEVLRNPITKFDPEQGVLQAQVPLFIPFQRIDEMLSMPQITGYQDPQDQMQQNENDSSPPSNEKARWESNRNPKIDDDDDVDENDSSPPSNEKARWESNRNPKIDDDDDDVDENDSSPASNEKARWESNRNPKIDLATIKPNNDDDDDVDAFYWSYIKFPKWEDNRNPKIDSVTTKSNNDDDDDDDTFFWS